MKTFSAWPVSGEFPAQRPVTWSFDVFFDLHLNKRMSKQSWGRWFETPSSPLWRHRNVNVDDGQSFYSALQNSIVNRFGRLCLCETSREIIFNYIANHLKLISYEMQPNHVYIWVYSIWCVQNNHSKVGSYETPWPSHYITAMKIGQSWWSSLQWPLLLTWFNFNPSMDK